MTSTEVARLDPMTEAEARACVSEIQKHFDSARPHILALHDRKGWEALGYPNWRDCVKAEFGFSQSQGYRLLEAAKIEREISPIGEKSVGEIPESLLRPLAGLKSPEEKREAWEEAKSTAPNGNLTAKHVQDTVSRRSAKPKPRLRRHSAEPEPPKPAGKSRVNGELVDDPPDIAAQRAAGKIAPDVVPEITDPALEAEGEPSLPPEPPHKPAEEDVDDALWLESLPLRTALDGAPRRWFEADALLYRTLEPARATFARVARKALATARRKGGNGEYAFRLSGFIRLDHPKHWKICPSTEHGGCGGTGTLELIGQCPRCRGRGYWIR